MLKVDFRKFLPLIASGPSSKMMRGKLKMEESEKHYIKSFHLMHSKNQDDNLCHQNLD